jgi:Reverse transcriptase (RNA-dependent DNA polymerase)
MFADDSAVFANSDAEATDILYNIANAARPYGLKINVEKTKIITSDGSPSMVYLDGVQLKQEKQFKYLGSLIQENKVAASAEIRSRIGQATIAFASLKWCLWKKNNVSVMTKMRIFRALILPVLLYSSETWTLLKSDTNLLETFQMRCLRQILGVSLRDCIRNETIRSRCSNQPTIVEEIQKRRLRWFGHACRMSQHRLPYNSYCGDIKNQRITSEDAKQIAKDRKEWKVIVKGIRDPVAPTAAYWLRGQPHPDAS